MKKITANIVVNQKIFEAEVEYDNKIRKVIKRSDNINPNLDYLLPGFIDLHVHGGGGIDVMDNEDLNIILKTHAKNGTTSLLLTTVTAPHEELKKVFHRIKKSLQEKSKKGATIIGIHLEGPYINEEKLGAQPPFTRKINHDEIKELNSISKILISTVAPEFLNEQDYQFFNDQKIILQLGHSNSTYEQSELAFKKGAKSVTHLFNAMSSFHHRNPGLVGASLALAKYSEIIPDLLHVHPGAIKAAIRSIPKLYFVTDATSATGMKDGQYKLGTHQVHKCGNGVRLSDGTLAGSALTTFEAFKNLISERIGLTIAETSYRMSEIPAELLNLSTERGSIKENLFADLLVIDKEINLKKVIIEGNEI